MNENELIETKEKKTRWTLELLSKNVNFSLKE
jgi:hypothetical protein